MEVQVSDARVCVEVGDPEGRAFCLPPCQHQAALATPGAGHDGLQRAQEPH